MRSCFFAQSRAVTKLQPEPRNATISGRALVQVRTTRAQKHSLLEAPNRNDISSNFGIALKSLSARSPQRTKATLYIQYPFLQTLVLGDFESRKTEREGTCPCRNKWTRNRFDGDDDDDDDDAGKRGKKRTQWMRLEKSFSPVFSLCGLWRL